MVDLGDRVVHFSPFALHQLALACRVPLSVLRRLPPATTVDVLQDLVPPQPRLALVANDRLRALTSTRYARLWDLEILEEIDRWLLPRGFVPAGGTRPALFRGDRDFFGFFFSPRLPGDDGLGGMRKGLFVWNSEVGARAFGWSTFYFRQVCHNLLVWDETRTRTHRAVHRTQLRTKAWRRFRQDLIAASTEIEQRELDVFRRAATTPFVGDGSPSTTNQELAAERLQRQFGVPAKTARAFVQAALLPENPRDLSYWGIVNGVSSTAKHQPFAGAMVDLATLAGKVLHTR
jgi:hypothetical protein